MSNAITDYVLTLWKTGRKVTTSASGWYSANSVCCLHNNETQDTKGRGGISILGDVITYSCFNCLFKTSFVPGRTLGFKFRKLLSWMGASENDLRRLTIESLRIKEDAEEFGEQLPDVSAITFEKRQLPANSISFNEMFDLCHNNNYSANDLPTDFLDCVDNVSKRYINLNEYDFYWTPSETAQFNRRVIIPYIWDKSIIGYTGRYLDTVSPSIKKYLNCYDTHYVFNVNKQKRLWKFVIVCEGAFDAMSVDGVAVLTNTIHQQQADIIKSLNREIIVVPDNDSTGAGLTLIQDALKYGWNVSAPIWFFEENPCKDINEAICRYGKLFVLQSILEAKESNPVRIKILLKKLQFASKKVKKYNKSI